MNPPSNAYIAFDGDRRIASGELQEVARAAKQSLEQHKDASILIFDGITSGPVDLDFRGTLDDVLGRLPVVHAATHPEPGPPASRGPGRPKLGVVAREVTLLPRHWEWLGQQAGGASVAIRKLVEEARRNGDGQLQIRQAREAAYRFMSAMAGNQPHFEEATRALFAPDPGQFATWIAGWPADIRDHVKNLAERSFDSKPPAS